MTYILMHCTASVSAAVAMLVVAVKNCWFWLLL